MVLKASQKPKGEQIVYEGPNGPNVGRKGPIWTLLHRQCWPIMGPRMATGWAQNGPKHGPNMSRKRPTAAAAAVRDSIGKTIISELRLSAGIGTCSTPRP
jgi:hypothetical protein